MTVLAGARSWRRWSQVFCLAQLALSVVEQGDWDEGARLVDRARAQVERFGLASYPSVALVLAICALVEAHRGRVEVAGREWQRSTRLLHAVVDFPSWYEAEIRIVLAHAAMRLDDPNSARQRLTEADAILEFVPDAPGARRLAETHKVIRGCLHRRGERTLGSHAGGAADAAVPTHALLVPRDR